MNIPEKNLNYNLLVSSYLTSESDVLDIYNSFPACTHLRMNFLAKFSVAHKLKFLSHKAHAHLHSKLVSSSFTDDLEYQKSSNLSRSQLASTSFISHSQMTKNLVSEIFQSISVKKTEIVRD